MNQGSSYNDEESVVSDEEEEEESRIGDDNFLSNEEDGDDDDNDDTDNDDDDDDDDDDDGKLWWEEEDKINVWKVIASRMEDANCNVFSSFKYFVRLCQSLYRDETFEKVMQTVEKLGIMKIWNLKKL